MKKLISIMSISTIIVASVTTLVSCSNMGVYSEIYVITDAGKVADKSFNQSGYEAGNRFINEALLMENTNVSYAQPTTMTDVPWMYNQAFKHGAKTLILPGYKHGAFISEADKAAKKYDGSVIFIDGSSNQMENTIGLSYRSDISGLWAGISSIMHVLTTKQTPVLATFGGMQNSAAVDPFMAGFLASVGVYNEMIKDKSEDSKIMKIANSFNLEQKDLVEARINDAQAEGYSSSKHGQWFTDSFDPGKGSDLSETLLIQQGANAILPVAGPQTADVLKILSENNLKGKSFVVGVDTDQVEMYKTYSEYFITSAEKDIVGSSSLALAHSGMFDFEMKSAKEKMNFEAEEYNDILKNMGNNLSITTKVNDTFELVETGLTTSEDDDWNGRDFWVGGSISVSNFNKINNKQLAILKDVFEEAATQASIKYFAYTSQPSNSVASETLSIKTINEYTKDIIQHMNDQETNSGDFLAM
ncbi:basic membrane protein A [Spiroplasma sp. TIUS-1]|uniref:hypothetical protein n=1 Tax=Spiroplasma sp. TIUS-1 TaxID=216963 RepID=UPI0013996014|nr:hypothetical protein [Spiroplasma sp. TIUS-1]QHX36227.1 basic membrane protein A [Spiroplasma sp. TIUS-1]